MSEASTPAARCGKRKHRFLTIDKHGKDDGNDGEAEDGERLLLLLF